MKILCNVVSREYISFSLRFCDFVLDDRKVASKNFFSFLVSIYRVKFTVRIP